MGSVTNLAEAGRIRARKTLEAERDRLHETLATIRNEDLFTSIILRMGEIEHALWKLRSAQFAGAEASAVLRTGKHCVTELTMIEFMFVQRSAHLGISGQARALEAAAKAYADFMGLMDALAHGAISATETERERIAHLAKISGERYANILLIGSRTPPT